MYNSARSNGTRTITRRTTIPMDNVSAFPIGGKNVEFVARRCFPVGHEHDFLPVGRKFRERSKPAVVRDLLEPATVDIDQIEFELAGIAGVLVGCKEQLFAIGSEGG